jgi:hypothetical protein
VRTRNLLIVCATALVFAAFFWPGRYRFDTLRDGENSYPVRTNRFTSQSEIFLGTEWRAILSESSDSPPSDEHPLTDAELANVSGTAEAPMGTMYLKLYNGSTKHITSMTVSVTGRDAKGLELWTRKYKAAASIAPMSSGVVSFTFTQDPRMSRFDWGFDDIGGTMVGGR